MEEIPLQLLFASYEQFLHLANREICSILNKAGCGDEIVVNSPKHLWSVMASRFPLSVDRKIEVFDDLQAYGVVRSVISILLAAAAASVQILRALPNNEILVTLHHATSFLGKISAALERRKTSEAVVLRKSEHDAQEHIIRSSLPIMDAIRALIPCVAKSKYWDDFAISAVSIVIELKIKIENYDSTLIRHWRGRFTTLHTLWKEGLVGEPRVNNDQLTSSAWVPYQLAKEFSMPFHPRESQKYRQEIQKLVLEDRTRCCQVLKDSRYSYEVRIAHMDLPSSLVCSHFLPEVLSQAEVDALLDEGVFDLCVGLMIECLELGRRRASAISSSSLVDQITLEEGARNIFLMWGLQRSAQALRSARTTRLFIQSGLLVQLGHWTFSRLCPPEFFQAHGAAVCYAALDETLRDEPDMWVQAGCQFATVCHAIAQLPRSQAKKGWDQLFLRLKSDLGSFSTKDISRCSFCSEPWSEKGEQLQACGRCSAKPYCSRSCQKATTRRIVSRLRYETVPMPSYCNSNYFGSSGHIRSMCLTMNCAKRTGIVSSLNKRNSRIINAGPEW